MTDYLNSLFDEADDMVEECRRTLNKFDQMLYATGEEAADGGAELLTMLAGMGDLWDAYRKAHGGLVEVVNDIYKETLG